jgi:hypothetical protein
MEFGVKEAGCVCNAPNIEAGASPLPPKNGDRPMHPTRLAQGEELEWEAFNVSLVNCL